MTEKITPQECDRLPAHSNNPNNDPRPALHVPEPDYLSSELEVFVDGKRYRRTGFCLKCNAAIYMNTELVKDIKQPLFHAVPLHTKDDDTLPRDLPRDPISRAKGKY